MFIASLRSRAPRLAAALLAGFTLLAPLTAQVPLASGTNTQTFDSIGTGLPAGWSVYTGATATTLGTPATLVTTHTTWANTAGNWRNVAAGDTGVADSAANPDRALAIRQTGAFGDPGAAAGFNFSTTGLQVTSISFSAQMLSVQTRSTEWSLQYGVGAAPASWTTIATYLDPGVFGVTNVSGAGFGTALDNQSNVWLRVVALTGSTGAGSRDTFGIDDFVIVTSSGPVVVAPGVTSHPANQTIAAGGTAVFSVGASGTAPLTYQWRKGGSPLANGGNVAGATSATLTLTNVQAADQGNYDVVVTNSAGSATSNPATLTVNVPVPPAITTSPAPQTVFVGAAASFSVTATGTAPLAYQWRKNGVNIVGATNATLALANVQLTDAGGYSVVVTNSAGSATSATANLTVNTVELYWDLNAANFTQDWSNTAMITVNDNWSGVPSIIGYLGQDITTGTGVDPQTLLTTSTLANDIDVIANAVNPNTLTSGGVAEFDVIPNPTIALQGSGTADAPNLIIHLNTSGRSAITVSYNLRDLDGSVDNAAQSVALQYRVGDTGPFTNVPDAYVADATDGPSLSGRVTPVSVVLPAEVENQPKLQLRIITANAVGSDEWVGVDDILVTSVHDGVPRVFITETNGNTLVAEPGLNTDTYALRLNTAPTGPVTIRATADAQTEVSADGIAFGPTAEVTFTNTLPRTVTVRAVNDATNEAATHFSMISHAVVASADPAYPLSFAIPTLTVGVVDDDGGTGVTRIHVIQGSGSVTPLAGYEVTINGVVTGFFHDSAGIRVGFYVQEEDANADANPETSEGVYVFLGSTSPLSAQAATLAIGDLVVVSGKATEFSSLTEVDAVTAIAVVGTAPLPTAAAISLPLPSATHLERFEGMRVTFPQTLTVTDNFDLGRFGQIVLSHGRLPQPTNIVAPGAPAQAQLAANLRNQIVVDDGTSRSNPDPTPFIFDDGLGHTLRAGDTTTGATGVLTYQFGLYMVEPGASAPVFARANPRTPAPPPVGGSLRVSLGNVLNLFNGDGAGGGFPTARGATTAAEYQRQLDKLVPAIHALAPDIMGLIEVENDGYGPASAIAQLVAALNASAPPGTTYAFVDATGVDIVTDLIHSVFIYRTQTVGLVGGPAMLSSPYFNNVARNPLAQTFRELSTGGVLTVCVNHFRAKASVSSLTDGIVPNPNIDQGDGQGTNNYLRTKEAQAVVQWLATDPTGSGDPDFLIIGDLNAYAKEDPITTIINAGYVNLTELFEGAQGYSYSFDGAFGHLDHALASASLATQVSGAATWHLNSDEPIFYDYNMENKSPAQLAINVGTPYRYSDHDPALVGLNLTVAPAITAQPASQTVTVGTSVTFTVTATGAPAPFFQWFRNGTLIPGATAASYTIASPVTADAGSYDVVVSNVAGSATSAPAVLTVNQAVAGVALGNLAAVYSGAPQPVTVTTVPAGLNTVVTYNGGAAVPVNAGSYSVVATVVHADYTGTASGTLVIAPAAAGVSLGGLTQTYDGAPKSVAVATVPAGLAAIVTYDGNAAAPVNAGSYAVVATVSDPNYTGTASGTLAVAKATAGVVLSGLNRTYDGAPKPVTATTTPAGLSVSLTYNGVVTAPTNVGSYAVVATVNEQNYTGSAAGTLVIAPASATVTLGDLVQAYDGTPKAVTVTTVPAGLATVVTYNGGAAAPVNPGVYAVVATISDANHAGSASGSLVITITGLVRHAPTLSGGLDGSLQVLLPESTTLNGGAWVSGDLLLPGTPNVKLNGNPLYGGTVDGTGAAAPANHTVTLNGNAALRHVVRRTDAIALPVVAAPPAPAGTRSVSLNSASQSPGDFATLRNLTLNGNAGALAIPAGTYGAFTASGNSRFILGVAGATAPAVYNLQSLTLNGNSRLDVVGPVILTVATGVAANGAMGAPGKPEWLELNLATGGLTLNGDVTVEAYVTAPNGTVTLNGGSTLNGGVASDRLVINGNGALSEP